MEIKEAVTTYNYGRLQVPPRSQFSRITFKGC